MSVEVWLAFVAAALVMGLIPGPGVVSIVGYAVSSGRRVALISVAGLALGNVLAMSLSLAGVGVILAASALAFAILKWVGAAYLIGLGIVTIRRSRAAAANSYAERPPIGARTAFLGNAAIGTFHPKTIVFFVAFVPQFISPDASYLEQAILLTATFCGVLTITDTAYALAASRAGALLRSQTAHRWAGRAGGGFLIASGVATAAMRR